MVPRTRLRRGLWVALACSLALVAVALIALLRTGMGSQALPAYGNMPAFHLTDQDGHPMNSSELRGKTVVFSFIYTNCPDECPLLTSRMHSLQEQFRKAGLLDKDVMLVSVSVDPERDTPPVLKEYAAKYGADTRRWRFLTGDVRQIRSVVVDGFMLGVEKEETGSTVAHSNRLALVDKSGQIRAMYDGTALDLSKVLADVKGLH